MKHLSLIAALTLLTSTGTAFAGSHSGASIRVQSGHFCAINKCVRFSRDLSEVSMQGRRATSVDAYNLRADPVVTQAEFRQIFKLALIQPEVGHSRR